MSTFFVTLVALCLTAAPLAAAAQSSAKVYRIGILTELRVEDTQALWLNALRQRGYIEGQNAVFEFRGAAERHDLLPKLAAELVQLKVDIILTASTPPAEKK